jgi:hypothetical protein
MLRLFGEVVGAVRWLWRDSRWGAIATLVERVQYFAHYSGVLRADAVFVVGATISLLLSVATIVFVLHPEAGAFWQRRMATA